ncbi:MAG: tetratricopeptide repeat protein [Prevotella sp.]|nr:tetratricopeptide repeat protein [Prevotella sp.]
MQDRYYSSEEFKTLLRRYEAAVNNGGTVYMEPDELTDIAEYYYGNGKAEQALATIDYALSIFPDATAPLVFKARHALASSGDTKRARDYIERITDTTDLDYIYLCAEVLINEGRTDEANNYLRERYEQIDDETDRADYVLDVATIYADYDMPDKAKEWLARSEETHLADYKELEGRIAISQGLYEKSEHIFNQLLDEDPYSTPYWNHLASSQIRLGHISDSITSSEYSIAINPNDEEAILNKANGLYALTNYDEALHYYQRFTKLCPEEDTGYLLQALTLINLGQPEKAVDLLRQAEQKALPRFRQEGGKGTSNLLEIYQELAVTLSHLNQLDEALTYIDKAEQLKEADPNIMLVVRGHLMLEHGKVEEAYELFQKAIRQSASAPEVYLHIAISLYDCGYLQLASRLLQLLIFNPQYPEWNEGYAYLAACHKELGHYNLYLHYLKTACEKNPEEARNVFFDDFPPELPPEEYYNFIIHNA